jgi:hypothetical protein
MDRNLSYYYDQKDFSSKHKGENIVHYHIQTMKILTYCIDTLGIKEGTETYRKIIDLASKVQIETANDDNNEWITVMRIIASVCTGNSNYSNDKVHIFSQSELCDFLTLAVKGINEKRMTEMVRGAIFNIYRDIIENYQNFNFSLESNYPRIIVDVVSIINKGMNTEGKKIDVYHLNEYYKSQKTIEETLQKEKYKLQESEQNLIASLSQITNIEMSKLRASLANMQISDVKRIRNLCFNYNKLQRYSKLIGESEEGFRHEVEKELGRKLTDSQMQRAINSIRKVRIYIGNVLEGKFTPHDSHGINHVKHNLEYGFQIMGLIECRRRNPRH